MQLEFMSDAWVEALAERLKTSDRYKSAAKDWRASMAIGLIPEEERGIEAAGAVLDLFEGTCRGAQRVAGKGPYEADYVIRGTAANWKALLAKEIFPVPAIMKGELQLVKGGQTALMMKMGAVQALLDEAGAIPTAYPG